jgi:hypothetical protein
VCAQNSSRLRGVTRPLRIWRMRIANDGQKDWRDSAARRTSSISVETTVENCLKQRYR